ncbi:MAG: PIN domain-containing protein [Pyrinomonadaceae bacterium]
MHTDIIFIRLVFTAILVGAGYLLHPVPGHRLYSALIGALCAIAIIFFELRIRRASLKTLIGAAVGSIMGIVGAFLIGTLISHQEADAVPPESKAFLTLTLAFLMAYVGLMVGAAKGEYLDLAALGGIFSDKTVRRDYKVLDTSVIIDGRISDVAETGFLGGTIIIPQFVLRELQQVADSPDSSKRQRGRRGLDMLNRLRNNNSLDVQIVDNDFPAVREVDLKLLELGKQLDAVVVTNDFNLNKVAQLHGVTVLNINELANSLKPVVLPGEAMHVFILKEGKEYNQGVAYLDDGTMVVVDNARRLIGKNADIAVTSVLQTTAGKMIFGRLWESDSSGSTGAARITATQATFTGPRTARAVAVAAVAGHHHLLLRRAKGAARAFLPCVRRLDRNDFRVRPNRSLIERDATGSRISGDILVGTDLMNVAIIAAGGRGERFGGGGTNQPKQFRVLGNTPIIIHTLRRFEHAATIGEVGWCCRQMMSPASSP